MLIFTFLLIWFLALFFILFVIISILENLANKYFPLSYTDVKPLISNSKKSFFVNYVSAWNQTDNIIDRKFNSFKTFYSKVPFLFKIYLTSDSVIITFLNKYAEVFKREECEFYKRGFLSYFEIIKGEKKYSMEVGFHHKQITKWINS